jgi:hypothetical protein
VSKSPISRAAMASAEPYFTRGAVRHVAPRSLLLHPQTSCRFCYRHPKNQPVHPHPLRSLSRIASRREPRRRAEGGGEIEVVLPGGARLTLRGRVEATALRAVLAALKA